jgi:hypothetical protein
MVDGNGRLCRISGRNGDVTEMSRLPCLVTVAGAISSHGTRHLPNAPALAEHVRMAQVLLPCRDLAASLAFFTDRLGFKVNLIFPADSPQTAVVSGHGLTLRLETGAPAAPMTLRLLCDLAALPAGTRMC